MIGLEKHSAPKSHQMKENGIGDPTNQRTHKKLQPDNSAFSRSRIQASGGRGAGMYYLLLSLKKNKIYFVMKYFN